MENVDYFHAYSGMLFDISEAMCAALKLIQDTDDGCSMNDDVVKIITSLDLAYNIAARGSETAYQRMDPLEMTEVQP